VPKASHAQHLARVPLFSKCSKRDLQRITQLSDEVNVRAGRVIIEQGRVGHEFFLILEGVAVVRRSNRKVATLGPDDHFGELALIDKGPRNATVVADTDMTLLVIGQREFLGLLDDLPGLSQKLLRQLAGRLHQLELNSP
jgi:CRP/FNR family transcriptional regulator, cyclic AMP receptor protein